MQRSGYAACLSGRWRLVERRWTRSRSLLLRGPSFRLRFCERTPAAPGPFRPPLSCPGLPAEAAAAPPPRSCLPRVSGRQVSVPPSASSMGSHSSKAAKGDVMAQDAAAAAGSPSKSNGQENGHIRINGDISPKADGEAAPLNGNGSAELLQEEPKVGTGGGDAIEPAPVAEGGDDKPEGAAAAASSKETPKKKKRFSFKKSFKLSGISFRKAKKESGDASAVASPSEEQGKADAAGGEEGSACATGEAEQVGTTKEESPQEVAAVAAPVEASAEQVGAAQEEGSAEQGPEEEKQPQLPPRETPEDSKLEETSTPAEVEPSPAPAAPEQSEE